MWRQIERVRLGRRREFFVKTETSFRLVSHCCLKEEEQKEGKEDRDWKEGY